MSLNLSIHAIILSAALLSCIAQGRDIIDDMKNSLSDSSGGGSSMSLNVDGNGIKIGAKQDNGNFFYSIVCDAGVSTSGFKTGCHREWKWPFYVAVAGGGLLALLLLTCCCCCCCSPCRKRRSVVYNPLMNQSSQVLLVQPQPGTPSGGDHDVQMLVA